MLSPSAIEPETPSFNPGKIDNLYRKELNNGSPTSQYFIKIAFPFSSFENVKFSFDLKIVSALLYIYI